MPRWLHGAASDVRMKAKKRVKTVVKVADSATPMHYNQQCPNMEVRSFESVHGCSFDAL